MALLNTARCIYTTVRAYRCELFICHQVNYEKAKKGKKVEFLSADDFLPVCEVV